MSLHQELTDIRRRASDRVDVGTLRLLLVELLDQLLALDLDGSEAEARREIMEVDLAMIGGDFDDYGSR